LDTNDNLYVLNQNAGTNGNIIEFDPDGYPYDGVVSTGFNQPTAFTIDGNGNLFIAEQGGAVKVVLSSGLTKTITTIATNTSVSLQGIAIMDNGLIAVSDAGNHVIWTINPITKTLSLLTGQFGNPGNSFGRSQDAKLNQPHQLARSGTNILVADYGNNRLGLVSTNGYLNTNAFNSSVATLWFGNANDPSTNSSTIPMVGPSGVTVSSAGKVYVSEPANKDIRGLTANIIAAPPAPIAPLPYFIDPEGIAFNATGDKLYVADLAQNTVDLLNVSSNTTDTFLAAAEGITNPISVLVDTNENIYVLNQGSSGNGFILEFDQYGNPYPDNPMITGLNQPTAFLMDGYGNLFVTEQSSNILAVFPSGNSSLVATITNAHVSLRGIALFDDGNIAVSDAGNHVIWTVNPITKTVTQLAGVLGVSGTGVGSITNVPKFNQPRQLVRAGGNQIVAADYGNNRLVLVQRDGTVTTNSLNSSSANIWFGQNGDPIANTSSQFVPMVRPSGVTIGNAGVFASETYYQDIRGLTGTGLAAPAFNPGVPLPFYSSPAGIALNSESTILYIADPTNNTVSVLNLANNQTTVFLNSSNGIYQPVDVAVDSSDNLYVLNQGTGGNGSILEFDEYGNLLGTNAASLALPTAMKLSFGGDLYVAEMNGAVQKFNSNGSNTLAIINNTNHVQLQGIALLDNGSVVVSDAGNHVLWKISPSATNAVLFTGTIGSPGAKFGTNSMALLNTPLHLAQANGGLLLIVDSGNNRVVVCDDLGTISRALSSTNATLWFGNPSDPVGTSSPNYVNMLSPVGLAIGTIGTNGIVFASENVYKDIRGISNTGIQAPIPPPPAPLNLLATATHGQVSLTWSTSIGATNYNVKRSPSSGGPYTIIVSTSATSYTDTNVFNGATYYYVVSAVNGGGESPNSAQASATPPLPPVADPQIGYVDFPATSTPVAYTSVFHQESSFVFNNDTNIVIVGEPGSQTYYTYGATSTNGIPDPTSTNSSAPVGYQDGMAESTVTLYAIPNPMLSDVTIKAIGEKNDGSPNSSIVLARFQFVTGNPTIIGNNAAQFTISDITASAHLYYTIDGSDPSSTNGIDLGTVATPLNVWTVGLSITTNTLFKVRAVRPNYQDSAVISTTFSATNFSANTISFGFASGEASSDFIASPGQMFYAPVTLSTLSGTTMYSLQFNLTVTNGGVNPGPAVESGAYGFTSMLMKPIPNITPVVYEPIPPAMFVDGSTLNPNPVTLDGATNFESLLTYNTGLNLVGVGWLERLTKTNLYDTMTQDLINYSMAHDTLFLESSNKVIVGGYAFQIPGSATNGQTYQIQIGRPSATSDGIGASGSAVYIAAPTKGSTAGGSPINAFKYVTVGQRKYLVGSVYPFRWFNAGDFGTNTIVNADVMQVFQSAVYSLNTPPAGSDFFDAMDSCGGTYVDLGHGYLEFNSYVSGSSALTPLFDGNDTCINQIAFGDGVLDVCDVYVTYRRSLDPSLTWFERYWNNGVRVADTGIANVANSVVSKATVVAKADVQSNDKSANTVSPQVNFTAGDIQCLPGNQVTIPITATVFGSYPLRVLMLSLTVEPLDGSPALTTQVQFTNVAALGTPVTTDSDGNGNYSAVWLNSSIAGLTGTNNIGMLTITIPAGASTNAAYAVHFDHASASPNGLASFPKQMFTGLITLASRTNSSLCDGIPDAWRLRWFGTLNTNVNCLILPNASAAGDGVSNWKKYVAGVDPNTTNDFPSVHSMAPVPSGYTSAIHWPTVSGKQYVVESASSLFSSSWTTNATVTGTGADMEYSDTTSGAARFYRVQILQ
jgi:DNA-binding beta-propeller fold protein YncE